MKERSIKGFRGLPEIRTSLDIPVTRSTDSMIPQKFTRLVQRGLLSEEQLAATNRLAEETNDRVEDLLIRNGIQTHELLFSLAEYFNTPYIEFDESVIVSYFITLRLNMEELKHSLWLPLSVSSGHAEVIAADPGSAAVADEIRKTLGVQTLDFIVALPTDILRMIEHNFDVNPGFPRTAGRTPLAKVRTFLADRRSLMACSRTSLAKGRTGLAFLRTGISFVAISVLLFRIFGPGLLLIPEFLLLAAGMIMTVEGLIWYVQARRQGKISLRCAPTQPTWRATALQVNDPGNDPTFTRTGPV